MVPHLPLQQGTNINPTVYNNKLGPNSTIFLIPTNISTLQLILNLMFKLLTGSILSLYISDTKNCKDPGHNSMSTYSNKQSIRKTNLK